MYKPNLKLSSAYLDGSESLSTSKFLLIMSQLKNRIQLEKDTYSVTEANDCLQLLQITSALEILFTSQDSPLYIVQQTPNVNLLANDLVNHVHEPLLLSEIPQQYQDNYIELKKYYDDSIQMRDKLLDEYITTEKFLRMIDYSLQFDTDCLMGISSRIRNSIEKLSEFNSRITESYKTMLEKLSINNGYNVHYVLDKIDEFEEFYRKAFPSQYENRKGNFEQINMKYSWENKLTKKYNTITTLDYFKLF